MECSSVLIVAALSSAALLVGCGEGDEPADLVAAGPLGQAVIEPARRTLVPAELPDGLILQLVDEDSGGNSDGYVRLYGEADAIEPLDGPLVAALWQWFDGDGALPTGEPRWSVPLDTEASFGGQEVVSGGETPVGWMSWLVPNGTEDPGSAGVVGRDLSEQELHAAAESLDMDSEGEIDGELHLDAGPDPFDPDWYGTPSLTPPPGLVELSSGRLSLSGLDIGYGPAPASLLEWRDDEAQLSIATYAHDDALAFLLRAGVDDPGGTEIRGHPGAHGAAFAPSRHGQKTEIWTWSEDGMDVVVLAKGLAAADGQAAVDSLRPSTDWGGLAAEASQPPRREAGPDEILMQDGFPGGSWSFSIACRRAEQVVGGLVCEDMAEIRHADGSHGSGGGGGGPVNSDDASLGLSGDDYGLLITGTVPLSIEAVEVDLADGTLLRPELHEREGWPIRAWAVWVSDPGAVVGDLRGYDSSGAQRFIGVAEELAPIDQPKDPGSGSGTRIIVEP